MAELVYTPAGARLAHEIERDLGQQAPGGTLIVIVTADAAANPAIRQAIDAAQDANRPIVSVLAEQAAPPRAIEHLPPLDFSAGYDPAALATALDTVSAFHMKVLTPRTRRANQQFALIFVGLALLMFAAGIVLVGVYGVQAPAREYAYVETEIILTRNYFVDQALPRTTEEALNFPATVEAARPSLVPVLVATATAVAGGG